MDEMPLAEMIEQKVMRNDHGMIFFAEKSSRGKEGKLRFSISSSVEWESKLKLKPPINRSSQESGYSCLTIATKNGFLAS